MPYPANVRSAFARQMEAEHILEKLAVATLAEWAPHAVTLFTSGDSTLGQASGLWRVIFENLYGHGAAMLYGHTMMRAAETLGIEFEEPVPGAVVDSPPPSDPMGVDTTRLQKTAERIVKRGLGQLDDAMAAAGQPSKPPFTIRQAQSDYLNNATSRYAGVPDTMYRDVAKELDKGHAAGESPDEMVGRVQKVIPASSAKTARMIARTESAATMTNATISVAKLTTSTGTSDLEKAWVATMDRKTRRTHYAADGQRVPVNGKFQLGRFKVDHPGDGPPEEARNCRCAVMILRAHEKLPTGMTNDPNDLVLEKAEIDRRAAEGNVRARDTTDGLGRDNAPATQPGTGGPPKPPNKSPGLASSPADDEFPPLSDGTPVAVKPSQIKPLDDGDLAHFEGVGGDGGHKAGTGFANQTEFPSWVQSLSDLQQIQDAALSNPGKIKQGKYGRYEFRSAITVNNSTMIVHVVVEQDGTPVTIHPINGDGVTKNVNGRSRAQPLNYDAVVDW